MDDRDMIIRPKRAVQRSRGIGDIPGSDVDPNQNRYVQTHGQPGKVEPYEALRTEPVPGSVLTPAEQAKLDNQVKALMEGFAGIAPFVRRMNWLDPPLMSKHIDIYTDPVVAIAPAAVGAVILELQVPFGSVVILSKFGNDLEVSSAFPHVAWNFFWKGGLYYPETVWSRAGVRAYTYRAFHRKLGEPVCPCPLAMPIIVRGPGVFQLRADNADIIGHLCEARFMGYQYAAQRTDTKTDVNAEFML